MKALLTTTLFLLLVTGGYAQSGDYMEKIAQKSCECLDKVNNFKNQETFNMELGLCMIEASQPYKAQLLRDYDIDFAKIDEQGEELGRLIGMKMATTCPARLMEVASEMEEAKEAGEEKDYLKMQGQITRINSDIFVEFSVRNGDSRTERYYWISYVDSNMDLTNDYETLVNKQVEITYHTQELFDARTGEYRVLNVLTQLNVLD